MNHLDTLVALSYPVLLGTSRKSMISKTLQLPADEVMEGTAATVALGIAQGCQIVRVHDIKQMKRVALMTDAIVRRA
jgi:dihydropteroate synthase